MPWSLGHAPRIWGPPLWRLGYAWCFLLRLLQPPVHSPARLHTAYIQTPEAEPDSSGQSASGAHPWSLSHGGGGVGSPRRGDPGIRSPLKRVAVGGRADSGRGGGISGHHLPCSPGRQYKRQTGEAQKSGLNVTPCLTCKQFAQRRSQNFSRSSRQPQRWSRCGGPGPSYGGEHTGMRQVQSIEGVRSRKRSLQWLPGFPGHRGAHLSGGRKGVKPCQAWTHGIPRDRFLSKSIWRWPPDRIGYLCNRERTTSPVSRVCL